MATIDAYAALFTDLDDTPASIAANQFARGDGAGAALTFFDLFAAANTWSADQSHAADILPTTNDVRDLGSSILRWAESWSRAVIGVAGSGTATIGSASQGGGLFGRSTGSGASSLILGGGAFPPMGLFGNAFTGSAGHTSKCDHKAGGGFMVGSAYCSGAGTQTAEVLSGSAAYGSFTGGYAWCHGNSGSTARINNSGAAAFLWAYISKAGTAGVSQATASGAGCFALGRLEGIGGNHLLSAAGDGSFVQGVLTGAGTSTIRSTSQGDGGFAQGQAQSGGLISTANRGAFAQGYATGASAIVEATAQGAFAQGKAATGFVIRASGTGSFAQGNAVTASVIASAIGACQFGQGTNALANSVQVGNAGLRFKGDVGAPGTLQNGDHWVAGGVLNLRSNGATIALNQPNVTGSRGGNAALASLLTQLAAEGLITDGTLA